MSLAAWITARLGSPPKVDDLSAIMATIDISGRTNEPRRIHQTALVGILSHKTPPAAIKGSQDGQRAEVTAMVKTIARYAPTTGLICGGIVSRTI